jgi:hypothetical protein
MRRLRTRLGFGTRGMTRMNDMSLASVISPFCQTPATMTTLVNNIFPTLGVEWNDARQDPTAEAQDTPQRPKH